MEKMKNDKVVGTAKIELELKASDVESIVVNALEGGISYWAGLNNTGEGWEERPAGTHSFDWVVELLLQGKEVEFYDVEDRDETWKLTLQKLIKGFELNYKKRPWDNDLESGDANTYDSIVQYALFGEIVYG